MSEIHSLSCPVCLLSFDADQHLPKISPICGHTLCKECLIQVLKRPKPKCPLDKLSFGTHFQAISTFPTNFLGKELLEKKEKWSRCESHKKGKKMICLTDNTLICVSCSIFGDHKGHDVKFLSDFADIAKQKADQLSCISEKIIKTSSELAKTFEEKKQNMKSIITERFKSLYSKIARQELEMLFRFENMFLDEKDDLDSLIRASLGLPFDIEAKLKEFYDVKSDPYIAKLIKEDFSDFEKRLDQKISTLKAKQEEGISRLSAVFQKTLPSEDFLKYFNVTDPLNQEIIKFEKKKSFSQKYQAPQFTDVTTPLIKLRIYRANNILKIEEAATEECFTLRKSDIEQITQVECKLKLDYEALDNSMRSALIVLSRHLMNVESISLTIDDNHSSLNREVAFYGLILALFLHPEKLKNIRIYASDVVIGPLYLFEDVLSKVKDLQSFDCTLNGTKTTNAVLRAITKANLARFRNLEKFRLNLTGASLKEQDIVQFFKKIPNVKDLLIGFGKTALTNQAIEFFSMDILPSLNRVQRLEFGFWETKLTDSGVSKLLTNLPNITNLIIGFNNLPISDDCLQPFLDKKLPLLTNLKELKLFLNGTEVSQNLKEKFQNWFK